MNNIQAKQKLDQLKRKLREATVYVDSILENMDKLEDTDNPLIYWQNDLLIVQNAIIDMDTLMECLRNRSE